MIRKLSQLTWQDVNNINKKNTFLLLPIGANEQHGPHLPLGTDDIILQNIVKDIITQFNKNNGDKFERQVLAMPPILLGNSSEHLSFPGTLSLSCETIVKILRDIICSIKKYGFTKLIILNSHGGNTDLLMAYSQELEQQYSVKIFVISLWSSLFDSIEHDIFESDSRVDIHAGERETSLLMYYEPDLVKESLIDSDSNCMVNFRQYYSGWQTNQISKHGTLGFPSYASAKKGKKYSQYVVHHICSLIAEIISDY